MHRSFVVANLYKIHGSATEACLVLHQPPLHERSSLGGRESSEILLGELNQAKPKATPGLWVWGHQRGY